MKKRIITGVSLLVVTLIAATAIILGFVQTNNRPEINAPHEITFALTTGQSRTVSNVEGLSSTDKELYEKLYEAYEEMFNVSMLTGIFTGNIGNYTINETSSKPPVNGNKMTFTYLQNQTLTMHGETYYSKYDRTKKFEYRAIEFSISEEDAYSELKIVVYLVDTINSRYFYGEIVTMANTSKIYNAIDSYYKGE